MTSASDPAGHWPDQTSGYDIDVVRWSERQATLLRHVAAGERLPANDIPDWSNIIEEIESVGRSQVDAVESLLYQAIVHLLKAQSWPLCRDADNWLGDARGFQAQARRRFRESMRDKLDVPGLHADAVGALPATVDGLPPLPPPATYPLTLDDLLAG